MKTKSKILLSLFFTSVAMLAAKAENQQLFDIKIPEKIQEHVDSITQPVFDALKPYKTDTVIPERGTPAIHDVYNCTEQPNDPQCKDEKWANSKMIGAGHHIRSKTHTPIIGVLMQPIPNNEQWQKEWKKIKSEIEGSATADYHPKIPNGLFIESSHVKYLESAGARVVPINFDDIFEKLKDQLERINGLYIPGDSADLVTSGGNLAYTKKVQKILHWAQMHNNKANKHFPVFGVGYGFLSMIKSQMMDDDYFEDMQSDMPRNGLQINLAHHPQHTYIFDDFNQKQLEDILDHIKFFSDLEVGISMEDFVFTQKDVGTVFIPVASFHDDKESNSNTEYVAAIEGIVYPWFGFATRMDKIQYSLEQNGKDLVDHSREAIQHAQKLINFFVDEARLSSNKYFYISNEMEAVNKLAEADTHLIEVPLFEKEKHNHQTIRTEIYVF